MPDRATSSPTTGPAVPVAARESREPGPDRVAEYVAVLVERWGI